MHRIDIAIAFLTGGIWVVALGAYALRVARFGTIRNSRVASIGGTALVGEGVMNATYWAIDPLVRGIVWLGITANMVTWASLVFGFVAGVALAVGWFGVACLLATVSTVCDILDGQVARIAKSNSVRGALLDSVIDRYTEFFLISGFVVYAHGEPVATIIALFALLAAFTSSYATAKGEALQVKTGRGLMRRHERAVFLILGAGLTPMLGSALADRWPISTVYVICLGIVAVIGNAATVLRLVWIANKV